MNWLHAFGTTLDDTDGDLQVFPPGVHAIMPLGSDGKPRKVTVKVDADTAARLEAVRAEYAAAADRGVGDRPYLDFNHEDGAASAWVQSIYWAGDDAKTGGVRAKVEWTSQGDAAVKGKVFRRFSPSFSLSKPDAQGVQAISGCPVNMGGLVNRAAFTTIQALFASTPTQSTMTAEESAALEAENKQLKTELETLRKELEALKKGQAERTVDDAVQAGRIPPAPDVRAKWVDTIMANPTAATLLASMPANPSLKAVTTATPPEGTKPKTDETIHEEFMAKSGAERDAFYHAHKDALLRYHATTR